MITEGLQDFLEKKGFNCPVIMSNLVKPAPKYPYLSYTVTSPVISDAKGYSIAEDGTRFKPMVQVWSFTAQSSDDVETFNVAMNAYNYFALSGTVYLNDNRIVVQRVGNITNRDNLLTIEYEYRRGFDVEFLLMHEVNENESEWEGAGVIETAVISHTVEI